MKSYKEWTDEEIELLKTDYPVHGCQDLAKELNRSCQSVMAKARSLGIKINKEGYGKAYDYDKLKIAIHDSCSYSEVLRRLNKSISSRSLDVLKKWIVRFELDDSKLKTWMSNKMRSKKLEECLVKGVQVRSNIKKRLYAAGLKKEICEECGQLPEWNGKKLTLQLDHVNGDHYDNRIENLRILCPNCHTQTRTFGKGMSKLKNMEKTEQKRRETKQKALLDRSLNGGRTAKELQHHFSSRKVERPSYDKLVEMVKELGYSAVGRIHGVSDNAIRKWIRVYEKTNPTGISG